jgi:hypothetical protein
VLYEDRHHVEPEADRPRQSGVLDDDRHLGRQPGVLDDERRAAVGLRGEGRAGEGGDARVGDAELGRGGSGGFRFRSRKLVHGGRLLFAGPSAHYVQGQFEPGWVGSVGVAWMP